MNKNELIEELKKINEEYGKLDKARAHFEADKLLLEYIDDEKIEQSYKKIDKWYE